VGNPIREYYSNIGKNWKGPEEDWNNILK
jgi:hypothetical protein